jgi:hypothetical protein
MDPLESQLVLETTFSTSLQQRSVWNSGNRLLLAFCKTSKSFEAPLLTREWSQKK